MKLLVCVKQVSVLDEEVELQDGALDPEDLEWRLNEWDAFALEAALQIAEAGEGESEVIVASVGDEESEEGLRECLAKGADRAVLVAAEGDSPGDPLAAARLLAAVAAREEPDLVFCGAQSGDGASAATGAALAGLLDLPRVAVVNAIELRGSDLTVGRELEGGAVEVLRLQPPALLTVQTGANEPRYGTLRAIKQAATKPLEQLSPADLGLSDENLEAARGARVLALSPPTRESTARMLEGSPDEQATELLGLVKEAMSR